MVSSATDNDAMKFIRMSISVLARGLEGWGVGVAVTKLGKISPSQSSHTAACNRKRFVMAY